MRPTHRYKNGGDAMRFHRQVEDQRDESGGSIVEYGGGFFSSLGNLL